MNKSLLFVLIAILAIVGVGCNMDQPIFGNTQNTVAPTVDAQVAALQAQNSALATQVAQLVNAPATATSAPTAQATSAPEVVVDSYTIEFVDDVSHDGWTINGTERLVENPVVAGWLSRLQDPAPELWETFPNIPNAEVPEFRAVTCPDNPERMCVPDGLEYGTYSSPYCFSHPCDIPVGAWEYRYIAGDYNILGYECAGDMVVGCMAVLVNVMDQSYTLRNQDVDNGFTLRGRYFNGDALEWGIWGLVSHGAANMLNMPTRSHPDEVLNAGAPGNSGANCGTPSGCSSVDVRIFVLAGDAVIAVAETIVTR